MTANVHVEFAGDAGGVGVRGVVAVFQTPFLESEVVDWVGLEREVLWLLERGADGVAMAMVSETLRLTAEERREMAARVCGWVEGRGRRGD